MTSPTHLTHEKLARYRETALRLQEEQQRYNEKRYHEAIQLAQRASKLLKVQFQATRVVLFGSITRPACFHQWSDIDIAAWGIDPTHTLKAIGTLMELSDKFVINFVDVNACQPHLVTAIERDGIEI